MTGYAEEIPQSAAISGIVRKPFTSDMLERQIGLVAMA